MVINRIGVVVGVFVLAVPALTGANGAVDLGTRVATSDEIVDYLAPAPRAARTRGGVRLLDAKTPAQPPRAISLQINFAYDSDRLSAMAITQLQPVGEALVSDSLRTLRFDLEGHTDAAGSDTYNLGLSERRAATVKRFFMERFGVQDERVRAAGRGERQLLDSDEPYSGVNRRVTVTAVY